MPEENLASFFDESRSAGDQLRDIRDFLEHRSTELKNAGTPAHDLIVHYVGHGLFSGGDSDYCLAIRATDEQNEGFTSIRMRDLAAVIRASAAFMRKYLIFDCCFSGAAYAQFQSGPLGVVQVKVRDVLEDDSPQRGTTLLCSASAKDPSIAPRGLPRTMFSDSLIAILTEGHEAFGPWMSFTELGELVRMRIKENYKDLGVRPEVHSPDQASGDVARVPLFPNPAWARTTAEEAEKQGLAQQRAEVRRQSKAQAETERIAREKAEAKKLAQERAKAEAKKKAEAERRARQAAEEAQKAQAETERIAHEKAEAKRLTQKSAEAERQAKAKRVEAAQIAREKEAAKRLGRERANAEAKKKAEADRRARQAEEEAQQQAQAEQLQAEAAETAAREAAEERSNLRSFWITLLAAPIVAFFSADFYSAINSSVSNGIMSFFIKAVIWVIGSMFVLGIGVGKVDKSPKRKIFAIVICIFFGLGYLGFALLGTMPMPSWGWCIASIVCLLLLAREG